MSAFMVFDVVLAFIIGLHILRGKADGFIKSFCNVFSYVAGYFCARGFSEPIGAWIDEKFVYSKVYSKVESWLSGFDLTENINDFIQSISTDLEGLIRTFGIDLNGIVEQAEATQGNVLTEVTKGLSSSVSLGISNVLAFILVFVGAVVALRLVGYILDLVAKLPGLHAINSVGGAVLGGAKGAFICWLLVQVSVWVGTLFSAELSNCIDQTYLTKFFYSLFR